MTFLTPLTFYRRRTQNCGLPIHWATFNKFFFVSLSLNFSSNISKPFVALIRNHSMKKKLRYNKIVFEFIDSYWEIVRFCEMFYLSRWTIQNKLLVYIILWLISLSHHDSIHLNVHIITIDRSIYWFHFPFLFYHFLHVSTVWSAKKMRIKCLYILSWTELWNESSLT